MPDLVHTLQDYDSGFLKLIAYAWGVDLPPSNAATSLTRLIQALLNRTLIVEMLDTLPEEARSALRALLQSQGRMPWAQFCRRFGELRVMGAARRDRDRPDLHPVSTVEILWYRGLIGKAFLNLPPEPQEYAFIPDEIAALIVSLGTARLLPPGRPAARTEYVSVFPATDSVLDHCCTLLAALRLGAAPAPETIAGIEIPVPVLTALLRAAGLLDEHDQPRTDEVRAHLEADRAHALTQLVGAWMESPDFNELRMLPGLVCEGAWRNDSLPARQIILDLLKEIDPGEWWSMAAFIQGVCQRQPDFQRPAGDYDSWFIRRQNSETYLRGFEHWDEIDGAVVQFMICGPLHWLGILDLAAPDASAMPAAFRFSDWAASLLQAKPPSRLEVETQPLRVTSDGRLLLSNHTPRSVRYQIARFCEWEASSGTEYRYRLTPASLSRAALQGLTPPQLISLLKKHSAAPLPPSLMQGLERWMRYGAQARMQQETLLRVASPEILLALQKSRAARYLGEQLTPTTCLVKSGGFSVVAQVLAQLGYLVDNELDV